MDWRALSAAAMASSSYYTTQRVRRHEKQAAPRQNRLRRTAWSRKREVGPRRREMSMTSSSRRTSSPKSRAHDARQTDLPSSILSPMPARVKIVMSGHRAGVIAKYSVAGMKKYTRAAAIEPGSGFAPRWATTPTADRTAPLSLPRNEGLLARRTTWPRLDQCQPRAQAGKGNVPDRGQATL